MPGTLVVKPAAGRLTRDTEAVGTMDPYVKVTVGTRQERSKVHADGGKFPQWSDSFTFSIVNEDLVKIECWNRNHVASDDCIGEGAVPIATIAAAGKWNDWVELTYRGRSCGHIQCDITYTGTGEESK